MRLCAKILRNPFHLKRVFVCWVVWTAGVGFGSLGGPTLNRYSVPNVLDLVGSSFVTCCELIGGQILVEMWEFWMIFRL